MATSPGLGCGKDKNQTQLDVFHAISMLAKSYF
jgi:hypothetical protein